MKVILKEDFINLGREGDTVEVKDGFARNYLLPKGFAVFQINIMLRFLIKKEDQY